MCQNGLYTERGIKELNGFMSERWRIEPEYAIKVDPKLGILGVLLEPASVVAKAVEQIATIGRRSFWEPRTVLITGAGPIGLLAALSVMQLGLEVHVLDKAVAGVKPDLVRALGATYHACMVSDFPFEPDAILECTGVGQLIAESMGKIGANGIICLTGIGHGGAVTKAHTADIASGAVLRNNVIVGSVNANKRHWYKAAQTLARADHSWLKNLITRQEKPENFRSALERKPDDIKVVIQFSDATTTANL
jgi:threonine dehydrogenase-like Zn-dependent dehydrogenase